MKNKRSPFRYAGSESKRDLTIEPKEPTHEPEFEVQATIWHGLRALGINARGEVKTVFAGRAQVRFDIAVFCDGKLTGIIETKCRGGGSCKGWNNTRQGQRYSQYLVPIRLVYGMKQAMQLLEDAALGELWKMSALATQG